MKNRHFKNLSANFAQLFVNQLCGLVIFYILSTQLSKNEFGKLNLVLAVMLMVFNLLTLGLDQLIIRKVAAQQSLKELLSIYLFHVIVTGFLFYGLLLVCCFFMQPTNDFYALLLVIGAGKLLIYFSTPFKNIANGLEKFKLMAYMLVISNVIRSIGLFILVLFNCVTLKETIILFVIGDSIEFLVCCYLFKRNIKTGIVFKWSKKTYLNLLREALPQTGVVFLSSVMSRFDWIFIGLLVSSVKLAEYSFAYKVFEISTLPLLAIAPLLLPWFTKLFQNKLPFIDNLKLIIRFELMIAMLTFIVLNVMWAPVVDFITHGKYGEVNINTIFFLSLCIPFLYINNFYWTIYFAQHRMKMILYGFVLTFLVNAVGCIILIPFFNNTGAAIAFLIATIAQTIFYLFKNNIDELKKTWAMIFSCISCALISGSIAKLLCTNPYLMLTTAVVLYFVLLLVTGQMKYDDRKTAIKVLNS